MSKARVYTISPGRPFLDALAAAILNGDLPVAGGLAPGALDLTAMTLILPTRRATRALQDAFLRASGGRALLLPRIAAIADGDEDLSLLAGASLQGFAFTGAEIPPAMPKLERCLNLTALVKRWSEAAAVPDTDAAKHLSDDAVLKSGSTPAQAVQLALALAQLMDSVETEGVSLAGLAGLVPETLSAHWQQTLQFLEIITRYWPALLAESGVISPKDRENRLIQAEAKRLAAMPPAGPVIVAGVTGSVPATAELMRTVSQLANGAIVLPALDQALDGESWQAIVPGNPEHPQFGLHKLLGHLGVDRRDVSELPGMALTDRQKSRFALMSEAMRPASTTEKWASYIAQWKPETAAAALDGMTLIEAPNAQDEAEIVALILREALETPGRTAALVSPDRLLARRVAVRLEAWGIRVDDSAGRPFAKTVPGAFLETVIDTVAAGFAPAPLVALLKHPLLRLGHDAFKVRTAARALEIAAFRAPYLGDGLEGVDAALERAARDANRESGKRVHSAVRRLFPEDWDNARDLVRELSTAFAPLAALFQSPGQRPLSEFTAAHALVAETLARTPAAEKDGTGGAATSELWSNEAGRLARSLFDGFATPGMPSLDIEAADYADVYRSLIAGENVRERVPVHPRLAIWGPVEARLQQPDVVVLGSLNDGIWPKAVDPGPWLNRPMRAALGLPSPEEQINRGAHDFISLLGAERVYLTRALKIDGVPTVPSRWLMRLEALLSGLGASERIKADTNWLGWARTRTESKNPRPISQPAPRPPVALRPRKLSVSSIETWIKNPYAIFARDILKLVPLDPLGKDPGADVRGTVIHTALSRFAKEYPAALPDNTQEALLQFSEEVFAELKAHPRVAAFWMPRFERFAGWFAETEPARRNGMARLFAEISGVLLLEAPGGPFTLTARADRIDVHAQGLIITDYKTGQIPKDKDVNSGAAPQLPLEAAIAAHGHYDDRAVTAPVAALRYVRASGGEPPGEEHTVVCKDLAALAAASLDGLRRLVAKFDDPATPYSAVRRPQFDYRYDDYTHLARVAEWSADASGSEEA